MTALCEAVIKKTPLAAADTVPRDLKALLDSQLFADVTFKFPQKDQKLSAHKMVLCAR